MTTPTPIYGWPKPAAGDFLDDTLLTTLPDVITAMENTLASLYATAIPGAGWTNVAAFATGWTNYQLTDATEGAPRYRKFGDRVELEGMALHGTTGTGLITTLPAGFRPLKRKRFTVRYFNGSTVAAGTLLVDSTGAITMEQLVNNSTTNLDGISFSTT